MHEMSKKSMKLLVAPVSNIMSGCFFYCFFSFSYWFLQKKLFLVFVFFVVGFLCLESEFCEYKGMIGKKFILMYPFLIIF